MRQKATTRGGWESRAPTSELETKALWARPRARRWAQDGPARVGRSGTYGPAAPRPAPGPAREAAAAPASTVPTCSPEPARSPEWGGGWRRHNRKFMARVTRFPLPQWGPVTLNGKLMSEERNLISALHAGPTRFQRQGLPHGPRGGVAAPDASSQLGPVRGLGGRGDRDPRPAPHPPTPTPASRLSAAFRTPVPPAPTRPQPAPQLRGPRTARSSPPPPRRAQPPPEQVGEERVTTRGAPAVAAGLAAAPALLRPAARSPRGAPGASWHRPRRAASLKAPPAPPAFVRAAEKVTPGGVGQAARPACWTLSPPPLRQPRGGIPRRPSSQQARGFRRPPVLARCAVVWGIQLGQGPGFQQLRVRGCASGTENE